MSKNPFFKNKGPITLKSINVECNLSSSINDDKIIIFDIKNLNESTKKDITFFNSIKYKNEANTTKAKFCITTGKLKKYLPNTCKSIIVENVLLSLSQITKLFYPDSVTDVLQKDLNILVNHSYRYFPYEVF